MNRLNHLKSKKKGTNFNSIGSKLSRNFFDLLGETTTTELPKRRRLLFLLQQMHPTMAATMQAVNAKMGKTSHQSDPEPLKYELVELDDV